MRDATAALLPAAATVAALPDAERRAAISRLATLTPGVFFGSRDLSEAVKTAPRNGYIPAFCVFATQGPKRIAPGGHMTISFENLCTAEERYGSWSVTIERNAVPPSVMLAGTPSAAETELAKLAPEVLRDQLSTLANTLMLSLFVSPDFAEDVPQKAMNDGSEVDAIGRGAMYLCSAMKGELKAGASRTLGLASVLHGAEEPSIWVITVTRESMG